MQRARSLQVQIEEFKSLVADVLHVAAFVVFVSRLCSTTVDVTADPEPRLTIP